jgi:leucyl aminopeptidase
MSKLTVHGAKISSAATSKSDIVVVPLFIGEDLSASASDVNTATGEVLQRAISIGDADAKLGKITTMVGNGDIARIMSVGCGDRSKFNLEAQLTVTSAMSRALAASKAKNAIVVADSPRISIPSRNFWNF